MTDRIAAIHLHPLSAKLREPFAYSQAWYAERGAMLVEIVTEQGLTGWGEAFGPARITAVVAEWLTPLLIGEDPDATERHWQRMYNALRDHGRTVISISRLDARADRQDAREHEHRHGGNREHPPAPA